MQQIELQAGHQLGQIPGFIAIGSLGAVMLGISLYSRAKLVRNTHDFIIAGRKLGFGFGVAGLVSVWTWVVGILMPAAVTYSFGLSGFWWFTVPNGLAVVAVVPFARKLKRLMAAQGNGLLTVGRADAFQNFGVTFTLALITATIAGQEFWNVAWGLRDKELGRSFFWGGALYYPIALGLGVLGLIGLAAHVDLQKDLGGDSAALAPFLLTHLSLPSWLIYLFVIMVLAACKSVVDGALTGVSTITAVDIFKRYLPNVSERTRFFWTRASMVLVIVISIAILLGGVNFVTLLLVTSAIRGAVLIPLILAIIWPKMNATAFVSGTLSALVAGIIARLLYGNSEIISTAVVVISSAVVPLIIGFLNKQPYDYSELAKVQDLQTSHS
jgi:urea-proton symporter